MKNADFWMKAYLAALQAYASAAATSPTHTLQSAHDASVRTADLADDAFAERLDMLEKGMAMGIESPQREPVIKRTPVTR